MLTRPRAARVPECTTGQTRTTGVLCKPLATPTRLPAGGGCFRSIATVRGAVVGSAICSARARMVAMVITLSDVDERRGGDFFLRRGIQNIYPGFFLVFCPLPPHAIHPQ